MSTDVMTNPKTTTKEKKRISTKVIAQIGVLGAIAMVLMLFDIPLPFAPTFYKIDFSEVPVLIGAFTMGPVAGALIELVKILLNLLIRGTSTECSSVCRKQKVCIDKTSDNCHKNSSCYHTDDRTLARM